MTFAEKRMLAFTVVDDILLIAHGVEPPTDPDFDRLLDTSFALLEANGDSRTLVWSEGGAPTTAQRHRMDQRIRALVARSIQPRGRIAILGRSAFVRVVIHASIALEEGWFGRMARGLRSGPASSQLYRAFSPEELGRAVAWLGIPAGREAEVARVLGQLREETR